jgi:hypothetical protein
VPPWLVLLVEDLHWADPAMLEFLSYLVERCTTCPAAGGHGPPGAAGPPAGLGDTGDATTLALPPLTDVQTASLVAGLLGQSVLPAEVQALLLERAEEVIARDRPTGDRRPGGRPAAGRGGRRGDPGAQRWPLVPGPAPGRPGPGRRRGRPEATARLREARARFRRLGAGPLVQEAGTWLPGGAASG